MIKKALFEIKNDEKALSDEELKSFVGDEGGLDCFATKKWQKNALPRFGHSQRRRDEEVVEFRYEYSMILCGFVHGGHYIQQITRPIAITSIRTRWR